MNDPRLRPLTEGAAMLLPLLAAGLVTLRWAPRAALLAFAAAGAVVFAFRDPNRPVPKATRVALAPADGRVIHVEPVWDDYWETQMLEIGIFLALWDVHIQRSPLEGTIVAQERRSGGYRPAMTRQATHGNNQLATFIDSPAGPCTVTQISGLVARRIVTWAEAGDSLEQGQRLGMIKFGSQVTLRVPVSSMTLVSIGDHVKAGITPMVRLPVDESLHSS